MANDHFRKPYLFIAPISIICEAVRFRLAVLTVRMTQRYGWEVPGGLVQVNLFPLFVIDTGMQKVVRVHYLPFARDGIKNKKFGLHNPLHIILLAWCSLSTPAGFGKLAEWLIAPVR